MSEDYNQTKLTHEQVPLSGNLRNAIIQLCYSSTSVEDTQRYAHVKIVDLQAMLTSLLMQLDQDKHTATECPQALASMKEAIRKKIIHLNSRLYNLRPFSLESNTLIVHHIDTVVKSALADRPVMKNLSYEWINMHDFSFYGEEKSLQAMITNIFDVGYQVAYKKGQGEIKLWTEQQGTFSQLHVKLDIIMNSPRQDDKRWCNIAPQASLRLTLALCQKVMTALDGNIYLISQTQEKGMHLVLSFPSIEYKRQKMKRKIN